MPLTVGLANKDRKTDHYLVVWGTSRNLESDNERLDIEERETKIVKRSTAVNQDLLSRFFLGID
jgi:hypothetical protein